MHVWYTKLTLCIQYVSISVRMYVSMLTFAVWPYVCIHCRAVLKNCPHVLCAHCQKYYKRNRGNTAQVTQNIQMHALYLHTPRMQRLLTRHKQRDQQWAWSTWGHFLCTDPIVQQMCGNIDAITYIPMPSYRLRQLHYNPSHVLARCMAHAMQRPLRHTLGTWDTHLEAHINPSTLRCTPQYRLREKPDLNMLLLDDWIDSGRTVWAAAEVLLQHGTQNVYILALSSTRASHFFSPPLT